MLVVRDDLSTAPTLRQRAKRNGIEKRSEEIIKRKKNQKGGDSSSACSSSSSFSSYFFFSPSPFSWLFDLRFGKGGMMGGACEEEKQARGGISLFSRTPFFSHPENYAKKRGGGGGREKKIKGKKERERNIFPPFEFSFLLCPKSKVTFSHILNA